MKWTWLGEKKRYGWVGSWVRSSLARLQSVRQRRLSRCTGGASSSMLEVCMEIGIKGAVGYGVEEPCDMMGRQGKYWLKPRALLYEGRGGQTWLVHW